MFYDILNDLCKLHNTNITATLKSMGVSTSKGTAWKNGSTPNGDTLTKLADYFECSVDYLLGRTQDLKSHKETPSIDTEGEVQEIINIFLNLNQEGRKRLMQQAEDISEIDKYKKCDDTEQDVG